MKPKLTIRPDGTKVWCLNGQFHREDGPAIEYFDGTQEWFLNGQWHREDGPAVEYPSGSTAWWLNGKKLTKRQLLSKKIQKNYSDLHKSYLIYEVMNS